MSRTVRPINQKIDESNPLTFSTKTVQNQENSQPNQETEKMIIELVIDTTTSFATIFPEIKNFISKLLNDIERQKVKRKIAYGVTLFGDRVTPICVDGGNYFSEEYRKILNFFDSISFEGGNQGADGKEDLKEGIEVALGKICDCNLNSESCRRGIIFLSDALPKDTGVAPDFSMRTTVSYGQNFPLMLAKIYSYEGNFRPKLFMEKGTVADCKHLQAIIDDMDREVNEISRCIIDNMQC